MRKNRFFSIVLMFFVFAFISCSGLGNFKKETPTIVDSAILIKKLIDAFVVYTGNDVTKDINSKGVFDAEINDDIYEIPTYDDFEDALMYAKYKTGIANKSDYNAFQVLTTINEYNSCSEGVISLVGYIKEYQEKRTESAWNWPVGIAKTKNYQCLLMAITKDGIYFFNPVRLYEENVGKGELEKVIF